MAVASLCIFVVAVVVGVFVGPERGCTGSTVLETAVCVPCEQAQCLDCQTSGSKKCDACSDGSIVSKDGKCTSCNTDAPDESPCLSCRFTDDSQAATECENCKPGYRLEAGKCIGCSQGTGCAECDQSTCLRCRPRYRLNSGQCELCSKDLSYCASCQDSTTCQECDVEVARMKDGKCTECRNDNNWFRTPLTQDKCSCAHYVDTKDGGKCKTCTQLMPGCKSCEYTDKPGATIISVDIGYDAELSTNSK